jgi:hypothetical protein
MNALISATDINYFDVMDDWDVVPSEHDPQVTEVALTPSGIERAVNDLTALFNSVHDSNLIDPLRFIDSVIRQMIDESSASAEFKANFGSETLIGVRVRKDVPSVNLGLSGTAVKPGPLETLYFPLEDIVTNLYHRQLADYTEVRTLWPADCPQDLIESLETADLQARYQDEVNRRLDTDEGRFLLKVQAKIAVEKRLRLYAHNPEVADVHRELARDWFRQEARLKVVEFRSRASRVIVDQVLYLQHLEDDEADGLLIFLDEAEDAAVIALPKTGRRQFIEMSVRLRRLVLQRLPLSHQIRSGNETLAYHQTYVTVGVFHPISPLQFLNVEDVFATLTRTKIERILADMDTLVFTDQERLLDKALATGAIVASAVAFTVGLPLSSSTVMVRSVLAFLIGQGASALRLIRAANSDDPREVEARLLREVLYTFADFSVTILKYQIAGVVSSASEVQITQQVYKKLTNMLGVAADNGLHSLRLTPVAGH